LYYFHDIKKKEFILQSYDSGHQKLIKGTYSVHYLLWIIRKPTTRKMHLKKIEEGVTDINLMDIKLPGENGFPLPKEIKHSTILKKRFLFSAAL